MKIKTRQRARTAREKESTIHARKKESGRASNKYERERERGGEKENGSLLFLSRSPLGLHLSALFYRTFSLAGGNGGFIDTHVTGGSARNAGPRGSFVTFSPSRGVQNTHARPRCEIPPRQARRKRRRRRRCTKNCSITERRPDRR